MSNAVVVEGISKKYILGSGGGYRRLTEVLSDRLRPSKAAKRREEFWALKDVSFEVDEGDVIGIIGRNGAGKSTLLKILSRITEPTEGVATLHGRVGSLLEVGTGFHPELTGRENVFLNGAVIGMRKHEVARRFDEIVAFAEIDRFLDTPVKRYSSGMYVRLAFAVAAHLEPEILVVDEVLAVGDTAFQKKCLGKMGDVAKGGRTVLFVSHNMSAIRSLCSRGLLLEDGRVATAGSADEVASAYLAGLEKVTTVDIRRRTDREGHGRVRLTAVESRSETSSPNSLVSGAPGEILLTLEADAAPHALQVSIGFYAISGEGAALLDSGLTGQELTSIAGTITLVCALPKVALLPGRYTINVHVSTGGEIADWVQDACSVDILEGDYFGTGRVQPPGYGFIATPHSWTVTIA